MENREVRTHVLEALRLRLREPKSMQLDQMADLEEYMRTKMPSYTRAEAVAVWEVVWDLMLERVLAPGHVHGRSELPWFHITEYGTRAIESGFDTPHDPDRYMERLALKVGGPLDQILVVYLAEALKTFRVGCCFATAVMLGVAAERMVDLLADALLRAPACPANFGKRLKKAGWKLKERVDVLRDALLSLDLPPHLREGLDIDFSGILNMIRRSRNEAGHPTGVSIDQDTALACLLVFRNYCLRVYQLIGHLQQGSP